MTITYSVAVDGKTVFAETRDTYEGLGVFPAEYLARPDDTPEGVPHPSPAHLYLADSEDSEDPEGPKANVPVLVGIQRAHGDEAEQLHIQASWLYAAGDITPAILSKMDSDAAKIRYLDSIGETAAAAEARQERVDTVLALAADHTQEVINALTDRTEPELMKAVLASLTANGKG